MGRADVLNEVLEVAISAGRWRVAVTCHVWR